MKSFTTTKDSQSLSPLLGNQEPINVLYVIGSLPLGGAENQVVTLASALNSNRYKIHVCCLRCEGVQANILRSKGIQVFSLNMRIRYWPVAVYRLYFLIKQLKPRIVHTHLLEADIWGRFVAKLAGVPVIISTVHGRFYWRKRSPWLIIDHLLNHFTDKIIAVSDDIGQTFIDMQGVAQDKVIIIPNAVNVERFSGLNCRDEMRTQLEVEIASPLVGVVARLALEKRLDHLLQAAHIVCSTVPQARFLIIGDGPLRENLKSQAMQLKLVPKFVRFLGSRLDIPELLSALDIFVISSETEGLPVSLLEAMAISKPVVATQVGGIPHLIDDGHNGLLVPPHDPTNLAKAILMLMENSTLRESVSREARHTVEARFSTNVVGQQIIELYDCLLKKDCIHVS